MSKSITISGVTIHLAFTFFTYKLLGDLWQKKSLQEVMDHIVSSTSGVSEGTVSFESMGVFSDIVKVLSDSDDLSDETIQNHLFSQPEDVAQIVEAFVSSMVVPSKAESSDEKKKKSTKQ